MRDIELKHVVRFLAFTFALSWLVMAIIIRKGGIQSGSVWVAMVYHAAHNLFLQTAFEVFNKPGPSSEFLGGESGVIPCVFYFLVLGMGWRLMKVLPAKTSNC